ncbi:hypothetical protein WN944_005760 [Citrus x changshan-huyou]|uniref:Uncharacterized protein n=1 Tax=Citrus x changshan-huyou TaxID=2935761 RepID=A0AAP0MP84_9ROSI
MATISVRQEVRDDDGRYESDHPKCSAASPLEGRGNKLDSGMMNSGRRQLPLSLGMRG